VPEWGQGRDLTPLITGKRRGEYHSRKAACAEAIA